MSSINPVRLLPAEHRPLTDQRVRSATSREYQSTLKDVDTLANCWWLASVCMCVYTTAVSERVGRFAHLVNGVLRGSQILVVCQAHELSAKVYLQCPGPECRREISLLVYCPGSPLAKHVIK